MAETFTVNYNWTKPDIGASVDNWGGYINADLDGIDTTVNSISTVANAAYPASNPSGYIADAPNNTNTYARKGAAWTILPPAGVTVSDTAPSSPSQGQLWWDSVGGQLYVYFTDANSSQWTVAVNAGATLLPASTTVLGSVKVDGTTIQAATDGTISTIIVPMGDNRIINGDMRIDQRWNGSSGTAINVYTADRWAYYASLAGKGTWQRQSAGPVGFPYSLTFSSSSSYASLAGDFFGFYHAIEADTVSDFAWGTAGAQSVTLSFWVQSSKTGTFGACVQNYAGTRSYPFSYSVSSGWQKIVVTIPGDTAGTWVMSGNAGSINVVFDLGSGANSRGPANAWANANYIGVTGAQSIVATNAANFYVTGVKLEIGSVATPYNRQSLAKSLADCQRYYQTGSFYIAGYSPGTGVTFAYTQSFPVAMRSTPTFVVNALAAVNVVSTAFGVEAGYGNQMFYPNTQTSAAGGYIWRGTYTASAEL